MADTTLVSSVDTDTHITGGHWGRYWTSPLVGALVYLDNAGDLMYERTTDRDTPGTPVEITTDTVVRLCVFADWEVPTDTGTLLHIFWIEATDGLLKYRSLDVAADTLGTERAVATLASGETALNGSRLWGCKTKGGNLLVGGRVDATTDAVFFYRSVDSGENWTSRTATMHENVASDSGYLFPAATADDDDAVLLYYDDSATDLSIKMYDDSADSATETTVEAAFDPGAAGNIAHFDGAVRASDGHLLVAGWNDVNHINADLKTWDITVDSIASPTVTAKTDVQTNLNDSGRCCIAVNQQNDDVYVGYCKADTAWNATMAAVYKKSTDGMGTWDTESAYSETSDDYRAIRGPRSITDQGGVWQPSYYDDDDLVIIANLVNDVVIAAASADSLIAQARSVSRFLMTRVFGRVN